jgi:hypothetical protein
MYATGKGDLELIQILINAGANVSAVDNVHSLLLSAALTSSVLSLGNLSWPMERARDDMLRSLQSSLGLPFFPSYCTQVKESDPSGSREEDAIDKFSQEKSIATTSADHHRDE